MLWMMFLCESPKAVSRRISRYLVIVFDLLIMNLHHTMHEFIIRHNNHDFRVRNRDFHLNGTAIFKVRICDGNQPGILKYAFQALDALPEGFSVTEGRTAVGNWTGDPRGQGRD